MIREILQYPDPRLTTPALIVPSKDRWRSLERDLIDTLLANNGSGLAAPQIGLPERAFVIGRYLYIDPHVATVGEADEVAVEECLSYLGHHVQVKRHRRIELSYTDIYGRKRLSVLFGVPARIAAHEYDHLQGIGIWQYDKR